MKERLVLKDTEKLWLVDSRWFFSYWLRKLLSDTRSNNKFIHFQGKMEKSVNLSSATSMSNFFHMPTTLRCLLLQAFGGQSGGANINLSPPLWWLALDIRFWSIMGPWGECHKPPSHSSSTWGAPTLIGWQRCAAGMKGTARHSHDVSCPLRLGHFKQMNMKGWFDCWTIYCQNRVPAEWN